MNSSETFLESKLPLLFAALFVLGLIAPFAVYPTFLMKILCYGLFACAFNLLLGFAGLLSFGHAAFLGTAGYVCGLMVRDLGVTPAKAAALTEAMTAAGVSESDLRERFVTGRGKGGQKVNKTASACQLTHVPTGIVVKCSSERSRALNRFFARRRLVVRLTAGDAGASEARGRAARRQKARRRRRSRSETAVSCGAGLSHADAQHAHSSRLRRGGRGVLRGSRRSASARKWAARESTGPSLATVSRECGCP